MGRDRFPSFPFSTHELWACRRCTFTIPIAAAGVLLSADAALWESGLLHGFNRVLWLAIAVNAAGGMLVAVVMKHAGNVRRGFAQACAIILGGVVRPVRSTSPPCMSRSFASRL